MIWLTFILGFPALLLGADLLIKSASAIAYRLGVPSMVIGFTIVAFGTSAPELLISIKAALNHQGDMAIGNVVGSNIANIFLTLGIAALLRVFITKNCMKPRDVFAFIMAMILLTISLLMPVYSRLISLINLAVFAFIMWLIWENEENTATQENSPASGSLLLQILMFILGAFGLAIGAEWLVSGGSKLALAFGISPAVVGLIFFAIGTSLPEIASSVYAVRKNEFGLALGNIAGSNIFNGLLILPAAGLVAPMGVNKLIPYRDLPFMFLASLLLALWVYKKWPITKIMGLILLIIYVTWVALVAITAGA